MQYLINNNFFGNFLKELRESKKISKSELARHIGTFHSYITDIENEKFAPSIANFIDICSYFKIDYPIFKKLFQGYMARTTLSLEAIKKLFLSELFINLIFDKLDFKDELIKIFNKINDEEKFFLVSTFVEGLFSINEVTEPSYLEMPDPIWEGFFKFLDFLKNNSSYIALYTNKINKNAYEVLKNKILIGEDILNFKKEINIKNKHIITPLSLSILKNNANSYICIEFYLTSSIDKFYKHFSKGTEILCNKFNKLLNDLNKLKDEKVKLTIKNDIKTHVNSYLDIVNNLNVNN